jgi:hypothetical protein
VAARCAHEAPRRVRLQPALALAAIPDAIFGAEHPAPSLSIEDREVAHREPERARMKLAAAALFDEHLVAILGVGKRIYSHAQSIAGLPTPWGDTHLKGGVRTGCRIR